MAQSIISPFTEAMNSSWNPFQAIGQVIHSFSEPNHPACLSIALGQRVVIIERIQDWYRGYIYSQDQKDHQLGIFPSICIHLKSTGSTTPLPCLNFSKLDAFAQDVDSFTDFSAEVSAVLQDWHQHLLQLLNAQKYSIFSNLLDRFYKLLDHHQALLSNALSLKEGLQIKMDMIANIEAGNGLIGSDLFIRQPQTGMLLKSRHFMELYRMHCVSKFASEAIFNFLEFRLPGNDNKDEHVPEPIAKDSPKKLQLYLKFKGVSDLEGKGDVHLSFGLLSGKTREFLSQPFKTLHSFGSKTISAHQDSTIFVDIDAKEIHEELYIVLRLSQNDESGIYCDFDSHFI